MKIMERWKQDWLNKNEEKLAKEFDSDLSQLKEQLKITIAEQEAKLSQAKNEFENKKSILRFAQNEIDELTTRVESKKIELSRLNQELLTQIRIAESKLSPDGVWAQAFTAGFDKAWDLMALQQDGFDRVKKMIQDKAISDTLGRLNGHKKIN